QRGVIQEAYPSVFTILVNDEEDDRPAQLLSFSYTDIITKEIRMKLC
ncbi:MAG: Veg family protein, partial [Lachnospiraceae bacterium]|nr:Veg family protein [Lachnospiraceae bacterium]